MEKSQAGCRLGKRACSINQQLCARESHCKSKARYRLSQLAGDKDAICRRAPRYLFNNVGRVDEGDACKRVRGICLESHRSCLCTRNARVPPAAALVGFGPISWCGDRLRVRLNKTSHSRIEYFCTPGYCYEGRYARAHRGANIAAAVIIMTRLQRSADFSEAPPSNR